jgi:hypothetical protein
MHRPTLAGSALAFFSAFSVIPTDPRLIVAGSGLFTVYAFVRSGQREP